ncbi:MAG: tryptophan synthase subunit alpha [Steroidobacteraceae bacterium]
MLPREQIGQSIRAAQSSGRPAIVAFLTGGFPEPDNFHQLLCRVAEVADVVEIGVPFSDPMADGLTIQRSSRAALAKGVSLKWILNALKNAAQKPRAPILLMSYLNPLLSYGFDRLPQAAREAGVSGFIVPDLPYEESEDIRAALDTQGLALVQMVTPVTPAERLAMLCMKAEGFVYAVTMTGTTGKHVTVPEEVLAYMDRVKQMSRVPVCAGFGIRSREQVKLMTGHVDGVVVGSALVEVLERNEDPVAFLQGLRG